MSPSKDTAGTLDAEALGRRNSRAEDGAYLQALGERVRTARARRGMSRKVLSRASGVSERYLAQLEAGSGNVSILLLRQIAQALSVPLGDLIEEGPERPVDLALIVEFLNRLPAGQLGEVRRLLSEAFGGAPDRARSGRIALIGLRGAGKSTLGAALSDRLGVPFIELDREVERDAGMSLGEIFSLYGQPAYRRHERRALERVIERHPRAVIATGGSLVTEPATFELLLSACFTVWIKASPEEHMERVIAQGDHRPMADNKEAMTDLKLILSRRAPLYAQANAQLETSGRALERCLDDLAAVVQSD